MKTKPKETKIKNSPTKKSTGEMTTKSSDNSNSKETDLNLVVTDSSLVAQTNKYQPLNDFPLHVSGQLTNLPN